MQRPSFIEPAPKPPTKKEETFDMKAIYRQTGMHGITANQLNEIERLEDKIRECLQIIRTLQ